MGKDSDELVLVDGEAALQHASALVEGSGIPLTRYNSKRATLSLAATNYLRILNTKDSGAAPAVWYRYTKRPGRLEARDTDAVESKLGMFAEIRRPLRF